MTPQRIITLFFLFAILSTQTFSQAWKPVNHIYRYNFHKSDMATYHNMPAIFTIHTIKDTIIKTDSGYIFNKIAFKTDSLVGDTIKSLSIIIKNAYQLNGTLFLLKTMRISQNGIYSFFNDSTGFTINTNPNVKTWNFDSLHQINATWKPVKDSVFLGIHDSVRTAILSTGAHFVFV